jgi:hypothetical protein
MKKHLLLVVALSLVAFTSCEEPATEKPKPPVTTTEPEVVVDQPVTSLDLAWSKEPKGTEWDYYLDEAMHGIPESAAIKTPCKILGLKDCAKQLLSIIAKRESSFKTDTSYNETGHLQGVVSRGLFQISKDSANQSAYGCNIKDAKELYNAHTNIKCAVKILAYQAKKTGTLIDGAKGGCGAYWSVCRDKVGSGSYEEIMKYMSKF